jgi:hypothetical protein
VKTVVPADRDAEERGCGGEREKDREREPLMLRRRVSRDGDCRRDECTKSDERGVRRR